VAGLTLPDGRTLIVSGADDRTVRRWDAATGEAVGDPLTGHTGLVRRRPTDPARR
jgi:WD40 repeat protein